MKQPPSERTAVKRKPQRAAYDRATIDRILDEGLICHVGFAVDGQHLGRGPRPTRRKRNRPTDQPEADDGDSRKDRVGRHTDDDQLPTTSYQLTRPPAA